MYFYDALLVDLSFPNCYTLIKFIKLAFIVSSGLRFFIRFKDFILGYLQDPFYSWISANPYMYSCLIIRYFPMSVNVSPFVKECESWFYMVNRVIAFYGLKSVYERFFSILDSEYEMDDGLLVSLDSNVA